MIDTIVFQFTNHGLSLLVAMEVWITWPVMTSNGIPLLILDEGPVVSDNKGRCLTDERGSAPLTLSQLVSLILNISVISASKGDIYTEVIMNTIISSTSSFFDKIKGK